MSVSPHDVVSLWFSERVKPLWFNSTPEFDAELREHFGETLRAAGRGELEDWMQSSEGALALVIVLDQFPLNIYRGQPEAFATEAASRRVAAAAIERGFDQAMSDIQRAFLYLPFMHSEEPADQDRSVTLFETAGLTDNVKWAKHHRNIIRRFGRFPHRNAILGRESTPEELAYLNSEEAFKG